MVLQGWDAPGPGCGCPWDFGSMEPYDQIFSSLVFGLPPSSCYDWMSIGLYMGVSEMVVPQMDGL